MTTRDEALALLTAEGPFALATDPQTGVKRYVNAPASFRDVFIASGVHGAKPFAIYQDQTQSYDDLHRQVAALAQHLLAAGVVKGDRVAIGMRNYPEWIVTFWAIQSIGAVMVALNAWWTGPELAYALTDSTPAALIIDGERLERLGDPSSRPGLKTTVVVRRGDAGPGGVDFDAVIAGPVQRLPDAQIGPDDLATILYTSGTTGNPKGAMATQANHVTNMLNTLLSGAATKLAAGLSLEPDPEAPQMGILQTFPFFHIGGLTGLYLATAMGARVALMYKWAPDEAVRLIEQHGLNSASGVPIVVRQLLESARASGASLSTLVGISSGGAPVPPDLITRIGSQLELRAAPANGYGLTETTSAVVANSGADYLAKPDSIGRPVVTAQVKIVDGDGVEVAPGVVGELWIRGGQVIPGYWNNPEATQAAFGGGWFRTGDLGYVDDAGLYHVVDRMKDVIIRGGENVYCAEVEAALLAHPKVRDAAVVGLPHPDYGEEVAAVLQVAAGDLDNRLADDLRAGLSGHLAKFKIPTAIRLTVDDLPRTATGKVLKRELRGAYFSADS